MANLVALLSHEVPGCLALLQELKKQQISVDVMGSLELMTLFYKKKEAFLNLHIGQPTLESLKLKKPQLVLFDKYNNQEWLNEIGCPLVGLGSFLASPSVKGQQLIWWPLPFSIQIGRTFFYGSGQVSSAVGFLKQIPH